MFRVIGDAHFYPPPPSPQKKQHFILKRHFSWNYEAQNRVFFANVKGQNPYQGSNGAPDPCLVL